MESNDSVRGMLVVMWTLKCETPLFDLVIYNPYFLVLERQTIWIHYVDKLLFSSNSKLNEQKYMSSYNIIHDCLSKDCNNIFITDEVDLLY